MRKPFHCLLALSLLPAPSLRAEDAFMKLVQGVMPSVVTVEVFDENGEILGSGSGFFISSVHVVSNYHVIEGAERIDLRLKNGKVYPIKRVLEENPTADVVIMEADIPRGTVSPLPVEGAFPKEGEKIFVIGSPIGLEQTVSDGIVSAVRDWPRKGKMVQITAPISPGSSGSPVLNMKGQVIGVATLQFEKGQNLNFAVPSARILELRSRLVKNPEFTSSVAEGGPAGFSRCQQYTLLEEYPKAQTCFEQLVQKNPNSPEAWAGLGDCRSFLGKNNPAVLRKALEAYQRAAQLKPKDSVVQQKIGKVLGDLNDLPGAVQACKRSIQLDDDNAQAHSTLCGIYRKIGRFEDALASCQRAAELEPGQPDLFANLGALNGKLKRWSEARENWDRVIELRPRDARAHYEAGSLSLELKEKSRALEEYKILRTLDEEMADKLFNLIYK